LKKLREGSLEGVLEESKREFLRNCWKNSTTRSRYIWHVFGGEN